MLALLNLKNNEWVPSLELFKFACISCGVKLDLSHEEDLINTLNKLKSIDTTCMKALRCSKIKVWIFKDGKSTYVDGLITEVKHLSSAENCAILIDTD